MGVTESLLKTTNQEEDRMQDMGSSTDSLEKILDSIYDANDIEIKTNITAKQIIPLSKGMVYAKRFKCNIMEQLCDTIMTLSVSKGGGSRKEYVDIAKGIHEEQKMMPSISQRLFGE